MPPSPFSLAQWMSLHGFVDVVERHEGLAGATSWRLRAEVRQPAVVGPARLAVEDGIGRLHRVLEANGLEGEPVREQDLGHDALALEVTQALVRVPLPVDADRRLHVAGVGQAQLLLGLHPLVVGVEVRLLDVLAVTRTRGPHVPVDRDDRRPTHVTPSSCARPRPDGNGYPRTVGGS